MPQCGYNLTIIGQKSVRAPPREGVALTFGTGSKIGIWVIMIGFGATFGFTVMGRISLLIGRIQFLLGDWLHIIK